MYWQEHTGHSWEEDVPNFHFSSELSPRDEKALKIKKLYSNQLRRYIFLKALKNPKENIKIVEKKGSKRWYIAFPTVFFFFRKVLSANPVALAENFARFLLTLRIFPLPGFYLFSSSSRLPPLCFALQRLPWAGSPASSLQCFLGCCTLDFFDHVRFSCAFRVFPCCCQFSCVCVLLCKWRWTHVHFDSSVKFG